MDEGARHTTTPTAVDAQNVPDVGHRRARLIRDLTVIAVLLAAVLAGTGAGMGALLHTVYGPAAFVEHYLSQLAAGDAAGALQTPGVAVDRSVLQAEGLPENASQALLRTPALAPLSNVRIVAQHGDGDDVDITAAYRAGGRRGTTTFAVRRSATGGILPTWRFARSPLAVIDLTVHGSMSFRVNGFSLDKRQVAPAGASVDPADAVPLLVFSPGLYSVRVDTSISRSSGVAVLSDSPSTSVAVTVHTEATKAFVSTVQQRVDGFLSQCTTQQVLQPTGCPFGFIVHNRVDGVPHWSMSTDPKITVVPDGEQWAIPATRGVAHIAVDIRSLYDGSLHPVSQDVPFTLTGRIVIDADGAAAIHIDGAGPD